MLSVKSLHNQVTSACKRSAWRRGLGVTYGFRLSRLVPSMFQWVSNSPGRAIGFLAIWSLCKLAIYQGEYSNFEV